MLRRLIKLFRREADTLHSEARHERRRVSAHRSMQVDKRKHAKTRPESVDIEPSIGGRIESQGPGKNVLVRKKYVREDTGTYETLKIVDDSVSESPDDGGIDPYNSGEFDRSKHWDRHFRS